MGLGLIDLFQGASNSFRSIKDISPDLTGKTIVITGANSGIGLSTATELARNNATVFMLCRSKERAMPEVEKIIEVTGNSKVEFVQCDLSDWNSVVEAAKVIKARVECVDALINNAGILGVPVFTTCKQNMELHLSSNHFGHFILTRELMPLVIKAVDGRIINVSSNVHASAVESSGYFSSVQGFNYKCIERGSYAAYQNYCQLANILFTVQLQRMLIERDVLNVSVLAAHPGVIDSNILSAAGMNWINPLLRLIRSDVETGAMTQIYAASHSDVIEKKLKGVYLVPVGNVGVMSAAANDPIRVQAFWNWTEQMLTERGHQSEWIF